MPPKKAKAQEEAPPAPPVTKEPLLLDLETCKRLLAPYRAKVLKASAECANLQITDAESNTLAVNTILEIKTLRNEIDGVRKDLGEDARKYVAAINDLARPLLDPLAEAEKSLRAKADAYAESAGPEKTKTQDGARHQKIEWDFEVEDLEKVPREWFALNETAIRKAINAGIRKIPGLKIFSKNKGIYRRKHV